MRLREFIFRQGGMMTNHTCYICSEPVLPDQPQKATAQVDLDPRTGRAFSTPPAYCHIGCLIPNGLPGTFPSANTGPDDDRKQE